MNSTKCYIAGPLLFTAYTLPTFVRSVIIDGRVNISPRVGMTEQVLLFRLFISHQINQCV
jgi:hypothetical protein